MRQFLFGLLVAASASACAQAQDSVYTQVDETTCQTISETDQGGGFSVIQACTGHDGWAVYLNSDDHGSSSAYARNGGPPEQMPYGGYVGNFGGFHTVMEWRLDGAGTAFATIHRYNSTSFDADGDPVRNSILIVSALRPGAEVESCHVGYVDVTRLANGNVIARQMADQLAADFACGEPIWIVDAEHPDLASARRY